MKTAKTAALSACLLAGTFGSLAGCAKSGGDAGPSASPAASASPVSTDLRDTAPRVRIVTAEGTIVASLDPVRAPKTVKNFLKYVDAKFYDGGAFFRAIPGHVLQGGNKAKESPQNIPIVLEDPKDTGLRNIDGALAMARMPDANSATTEFFIDDGAQPVLDGSATVPGFAVFGHVVSGMSVVKKIISGKTERNILVEPVTILKIERVP
jgi:cyclophilin family peptidyl-prolyl cis-trans isomerase